MKGQTKKPKVAVLAGGIGSEREVSLNSGRNVFNAIQKAGLPVVLSDINPDDLSILDDRSIDVFFLALHGQFGEDGQLQEILEGRGLCYTGSGSQASATAFDKAAAKKIFGKAGLTVAPDVCIYEKQSPEIIADRLAKVGEKFVVKPIKQGSSIGVEIISGTDKAADSALKCLETFGDCMVENFIAGKEITVGIVDGQTLPTIEIRSMSGFYDYHAKYIDDATEYLFDTVTDETSAGRICSDALKAFELLGCRHFGRVDMILTEQGEPYLLEVNTLPGFTSHSLLPMAAARAGIETGQLCVRIVEAAFRDFGK